MTVIASTAINPTRALLIALFFCRLAVAADPVRSAWIMSPSGSPMSLRSSPEVHSVSSDERYVVVRSAGISLKYFGPLQNAPTPSETLREFVFKIPLHPEPETGRHARVPADVIGAFANGLPIYNHFEALSWNGANLWHYDAVAYNDNGALTAAGRPRAELTHPSTPGLLEQLVENGSRHSPLIGFALDGYPVYGPWAFANADGSGGLRRMRSSYRLRPIARRHDWPDGTRLTPEQYGPDVSPNDPLGTFAEDYEYVPGSGDLDQFNGRFTKTPEFPDGTYAYFLTTGGAGRLAFPYLIGPRFYGRVPEPPTQSWNDIAHKRLTLRANVEHIESGRSVLFQLDARNDAGDPIRHFEYVHERPIHFLIASADLAEFDHIHPELTAGDSYQVAHTFAHGGKYRIWADYSLPGEPPQVDAFDVTVAGPARPPQKLVASPALTEAAGSLTVKLTPSKPLRAGDDIPIALNLSGSLDTLEPYLGAWAHVIVIGEGYRSFAHAHPVETAAVVHTHAAAGPPPNAIHIVTNFPSAGMYKVWAQFQRSGQLVTVPFVLRVEPAEASPKPITNVPADAIRIQLSERGYIPARVEIPANRPLTLAFTRDASPNCGSEVIFPTLGIRRTLPVGETVVVQLPAQPAGEISFGCGMGMYRGMIVAQ
jgi:YHYH protein/Cupredoxin-like domain